MDPDDIWLMEKTLRNRSEEMQALARRLRSWSVGVHTINVAIDTLMLASFDLEEAVNMIGNLAWKAHAAGFFKGECEVVGTATDGMMCQGYEKKRYELSCGHAVTLDGFDPPVACAVCGRKVKL